MKTGQIILIQLCDEHGDPVEIAGIVIALDLFIRGQFRYSFRVGKTDHHGFLTIRYEDVDAWRVHWSKTYLMDYKDRLEICDSKIRVFVPPKKALLEAYENLKESSLAVERNLATDFFNSSNHLIACADQEVELDDSETRVNLTCKRCKPV